MRAQALPEGAGGVPRALVVMEDEAAVVWRTLPANPPALSRIATFPVMRSDIDQLTTLREKAPVTAAR